MACLLTKDGTLRIYNLNSSSVEEMLENPGAYSPSEALDVISLKNNGPSLLPKQFSIFPGRVHGIAAMQNEITILADRVEGRSPIDGEEEKAQ